MAGLFHEKLLVELEDVDAEDRDKHPRCPHGPTVLFYRVNQTAEDAYFACAAHRNPKECNFFMNRREWILDKRQFLPQITDYPIRKDGQFNEDPTRHMKALSQDKVNAQYFFDDQALEFFALQCKTLKINKVICMGTPRLHFHLRRKDHIQSFLLDFDERFAGFLQSQEFCLYNMCNNHFFYDRKYFEDFLVCNHEEQVLIVTDPPFGCRTELIANSLRQISRQHNRLNNLSLTPLSIFWIYPYYMANYIKEDMPELEMCDYKLNYTNHGHYTNVGSKCRAYGSPVRVFTNVPLKLLMLNPAEGYKYCDKCDRFTASENAHCDLCSNCPSKNGQTYIHCRCCHLCVKPNYVHCANCRRCCQRDSHDCELYQRMQVCWICGNRGHIETKCTLMKSLQAKRKSKKLKGQLRVCLICGKNHNERNCQLRSKYFKESQFMGRTVVTLRSRR